LAVPIQEKEGRNGGRKRLRRGREGQKLGGREGRAGGKRERGRLSSQELPLAFQACTS